ncbi:MAG: heme-binding protein [Pseudomonadota bacterium]|nr:heme-binding protein [Gammaproteobacteria bacterium]MDQ3581063.1 heme-binding protein [Pseudomonadota bacterium]
MRSASTWVACRALVLLAALLAVGETHAANSNCVGSCANAGTFLRASQVQRIIAQAVAEAQARNRRATIAVVDRVGNVLAVFQMNGARAFARITSGRFNRRLPQFPDAGLEEIQLPIAGAPPGVPSSFAAIAKAITAAYLSSEGNAFGSRTANQIVQEFFNPGERGQPSGPLFGVQFSQLPCGDLVQQGEAVGIGPRRSPLGLSADPGGLTLYLRGTPVGGIGVIADGIYGVDANIVDVDQSVDELIALAGTAGFEAPENRRADRIAVGGLLLRYSDAVTGDLLSDPGSAPAFSSIDGRLGTLVAASGFYPTPPVVRRGTAFGQRASGIIPADQVRPPLFGRGLDAFVLADSTGANRFPPIAGAPNDGQRLTASEVRTLLREGIEVANSARANIRQPNGSQVRVTLSVVDVNGTILGVARTRDAPVFGIDVSLQKARAAAFFSSPDAAASLSGTNNPLFAGALRGYVRDTQAFVDPPFRGRVFEDGVAYSNRAIGNLARPYFPDGIESGPTGPLSKPGVSSGPRQGIFRIGVNEWSPFNVGIQLDLVAPDVIGSLLVAPNTVRDCGTSNAPSIALGRLANGIQIFPGSVPIFKSGVLVGALGISGDGVDQDDMVAFLGVNNASVALRGRIRNAPRGRRADRVRITQGGSQTLRLRYVQCPVAPFIGSDVQTPCKGK